MLYEVITATHILDIGCGAGNYTLKLLEKHPNLDVTLIDLSKPMLDRATERITAASSGTIHTIQGDIREIQLKPNSYDIILAAAVLHHLRDDSEWESVFKKIYRITSYNVCYTKLLRDDKSCSWSNYDV